MRLVCFQHDRVFAHETEQAPWLLQHNNNNEHEALLLRPAADDRKCFHEHSVIKNLDTSCLLGDAE